MRTLGKPSTSSEPRLDSATVHRAAITTYLIVPNHGNQHRSNKTPDYVTLTLNGWTGKRLAEELSITTSKVSRTLALLDLPEDVQIKIRDGELSRTSANELTKLDNPALQQSLAAKPLTQAEAEYAVRKLRGKPLRSGVGRLSTFEAVELADGLLLTEPSSGS